MRDSIELDGTISNAQEDAARASKTGRSSLAAGTFPEQSKDRQTIDSSIKDPAQSIADTKTVTIDASQPEEIKQGQTAAPDAQQS